MIMEDLQCKVKDRVVVEVSDSVTYSYSYVKYHVDHNSNLYISRNGDIKAIFSSGYWKSVS